MEKQNPLLPFAFTRANSSEIHLDTTPRSREVIDENAKSIYHTRTPDRRRPLKPGFVPNLKRRMGESFNEKDDVKRRDYHEDVEAVDFAQDKISDFNSEPIDSEEPTMIDSDFKIPHDKENFVPPSSPPIHLNSDYDVSNYSIPFSPSQHVSETGYSPNKIRMSQRSIQLESETDFGIDKFNRFRPNGNDCPSTDHEIDHENHLQKQNNLRARDIVIEAFEEMQTSINLEGLGLTEIPHEIKDLNNLVVFDTTQTIYQVYLTNNKIRFLTPALFKFTKMNVLGLRKNKIVKIPALIKKLVHLTDLSIGTNRLTYLPHQILTLPSLRNFTAGPNPYLALPEDATPRTSNTDKYLRYRSPIKYFEYHNEIKSESTTTKLVPSLKSICLAQIAKYDVSYQETKEWKHNTPKLFHNLIIQAIHQGNFEETCFECDRIIVEPVAEVIEWWNFLQNKDIPFKKEFCSGMCAKRYSDKIDDL